MIGLSAMSMAQNAADTLQPFNIRATYYSDIFIGRHTSSGEIFRQDLFTAAHKTLPFGTLVLVTNLENGSQVIVKVNDRCPKKGILDLTKRAATILGIGSRVVRAQILPRRYVPIWENMHLYEQEMKEGTLLSLSPETPPRQTVENNRPDDKQLAVAVKDVTAMAADTAADYILLLGVAADRRQAETLIDRLPLKYQNSVELLPGRDAARVRMLLDMRMTHKEAETVKKELEYIFPKSQVRKANNYE